jgi:hypothetical protein
MNTKAIIVKQKKLITEYEALIALCNSKEFFSIPSVNILKFEIAALEAEEDVIKTTINPSNLYPEPTAVEAKEVKSAEKVLTSYLKHNNCSDEFIKNEIERFLNCPKCNQFKDK